MTKPSTIRGWRQAASVIIASKHGTSHKIEKFDWKLLLLKRSGKSRFMPNVYVFPGGVVDAVDGSSEWKDCFKKTGWTCETLAQYTNSFTKSRPPCMQELVADKGISLDPFLAFKISAVRETFEEAGILLSDSQCATIESPNDWRKKIIKDPSKFLELFKQLECAPDVTSLYEWSCWLTPRNLSYSKRFDTMFYIYFFDSLPKVSLDNQEVTNMEWLCPDEVLKKYYAGNISLGPPQIYAISQLANFKTMDTLLKFAKEREEEGVQRWTPVRSNATDGIITSLPGDDNYPSPEDVETVEERDLGISLEESRKQSKYLNRSEFDANRVVTVSSNLQLPNGYITPLDKKEILDT